MAKNRAVDDDGKPIDPSTDLRKFIEKVAPPSVGSAAAAADAPAEPTWKTMVFADAEDEDLKGKTGEQVAGILAQRRKDAKEAQDRATTYERQLSEERQTRQMEDIARRTYQQSQPAQTPQPEQEDPRIQEINLLWVDDPARARTLLQQMNEEQTEKRLAKLRTDLKGEIDQESRSRRINEDAQNAYGALRNYLVQNGVPGEVVDGRSRALLSEVTFQGSPFYANGSVTNPRNLLAAWNHLFGEAKPATATPTPPAAAQPSATPTPPTPPGSGRPAPAAAPGGPAAKGTLSDKQRMAREYVGPRVGLDVDKLLERGRKRNANA